MQNIKLHEATKQFDINNKLAMFFLKKNGMPVKSHSSSITMDQLEMLREFAENKEGQKALMVEFKKSEIDKQALHEEALLHPQPDIETKEAEEDLSFIPVPTATPTIPAMVATQVQAAKGIEAVQSEVKPEKPAQPQVSPTLEKEAILIMDKPLTKATLEKETEPLKTVIQTPDEAPTAKKPLTAIKRDTPPVRAHTPTDALGKGVPKPDISVGRPPSPGVDQQRREKIFRRQPTTGGQPGMRSGRKPGRGPGGRRREKITVQPKIMGFDLPKNIKLPDYVTLKEIAEKLDVKMKHIEEKLSHEKRNYPANQVLKKVDILDVCELLGVEVEVLSYEDYLFANYIESHNSVLTPRPPVITVMGHVDHGKTTLLDTLRNTRVAEREAGGITQSIGAYELKSDKGTFIFIDTPGHEAFTNLRARGAQVTDIVILVVAANDGVQPQTVEAINHARLAKVPIVVAINKIDLQGADSMRVKQDLTKHEIVVEEWGGDVVSVEISAKLNQNIEALLEMLSLVAEMLEVKSYLDIPARGTMIESRLDPKLGPLGTVLIQHGRLVRGDHFISGNSIGKVKAIFDDRGNPLIEAIAPQPVEIMGFDVVPQSGDRFQVVDDPERARKVIELRILSGKEERDDVVDADKKLNMQNMFDRLEGDVKDAKEIAILVKVDNFGSSEVLEEIIRKLEQEKVKINIIHKGIGNISESDVLLASTTGAMIIGFNVKAPPKTLVLAKREAIDIKLYNVIYHLIEDLQKAIKGQIEPEYAETQIGKVEVLNKFKISKVGMVAGCRVKEGKITNKSRVKVFRNEELAFEGTLETLKRNKDEVSEVKAGTECGIKIKNFNSIEIGDIIEAFELTLIS